MSPQKLVSFHSCYHIYAVCWQRSPPPPNHLWVRKYLNMVNKTHILVGGRDQIFIIIWVTRLTYSSVPDTKFSSLSGYQNAYTRRSQRQNFHHYLGHNQRQNFHHYLGYKTRTSILVGARDQISSFSRSQNAYTRRSQRPSFHRFRRTNEQQRPREGVRCRKQEAGEVARFWP